MCVEGYAVVVVCVSVCVGGGKGAGIEIAQIYDTWNSHKINHSKFYEKHTFTLNRK